MQFRFVYPFLLFPRILSPCFTTSCAAASQTISESHVSPRLSHASSDPSIPVPSSALLHRAPVYAALSFCRLPIHIACSLRSSVTAKFHAESHKFCAVLPSTIESSFSIPSVLERTRSLTNATAYSPDPAAPTPRTTQNPARGKQLTSTIVVIDHDITTTDGNWCCGSVRRPGKKGADNAVTVKGRPLDLPWAPSHEASPPCDRSPAP